jgi:hypothetical protein
MGRFLLVALSGSMLLMTFAGCPGGAFNQAVQRYSPHQVEYARAVSACSSNGGGGYSDECIVSWAFPMSGLQCLVDEDTKKSKPGAQTRACACSRATDAADRAKTCSDWLAQGN